MASNSVGVVFDVAALMGAALCIYVMQKTEVDRIARIDPAWLRWLRRLWFVVLALVLCYSVWDITWQPSVPVMLLVMVGVGNLAINAIALHLRSPPDNTSRLALSHGGAIQRFEALRQLFVRHKL